GKQSRVLLLHSYADRFTHEFFISSANPTRAAVEAVFLALRTRAGTEKFIESGDDLQGALKAGISPRQVESAIRILAATGLISMLACDTSVIRVRLTGTFDRIASELRDNPPIEIGFLRALWRAHGTALQRGVEVDLNGLPPGLNGAAICVPILDTLQSRQLLHWSRIGGGIRIITNEKSVASFDIDW